MAANKLAEFDGDELRARLRATDRQPFMELLAGWLDCLPTPEAVKGFANKYPDRYAVALGQIARLAGYSDKSEVTHNVNMTVHQMSDSQLEDRTRAKLERLGLPVPLDVPFQSVVEGQQSLAPERDAALGRAQLMPETLADARSDDGKTPAPPRNPDHNAAKNARESTGGWKSGA